MKVIADIGSNWNSLDDCFNAVEKCKESDIDIVKFQYYTHEKLYGFPGEMAGELPKDWIPQIADHAKGLGVEFMCSVFDPEDVAFIDQFVERHKVASSENAFRKLIIEIEKTGKQYLVSHGCEDSCNDPIDYDDPNYVSMACISQYPTTTYPIEDLCSFVESRSKYYGLSDHNLNPYGYELAYRFGCSFYEFHFNPMKIEGKPDQCVSRTEFNRPIIETFEKKPGRKFLRPYPAR